MGNATYDVCRPDWLPTLSTGDGLHGDAEPLQGQTCTGTTSHKLAPTLFDRASKGALLLWKQSDIQQVPARLGGRDGVRQEALDHLASPAGKMRRGGKRSLGRQLHWRG
jgi:hypothetical protein